MYALKFNFLFIFLLNCFLFNSSYSVCQTNTYFVVEYPGTSQRHLFKTVDDISLKLKNETIFLSGTIELLLDSSKVVEGYALQLKEIEKIKLERKKDSI